LHYQATEVQYNNAVRYDKRRRWLRQKGSTIAALKTVQNLVCKREIIKTAQQKYRLTQAK